MKKRLTKTQRRARDVEYKKTQRRLNREHLAAAGFDGDPEKFVTRWRRGEIRVTFEILETSDDRHKKG